MAGTSRGGVIGTDRSNMSISQRRRWRQGGQASTMRPLRKCGCGIGGDGRNLRSGFCSGGSTIKIASARPFLYLRVSQFGALRALL